MCIIYICVCVCVCVCLCKILYDNYNSAHDRMFSSFSFRFVLTVLLKVASSMKLCRSSKTEALFSETWPFPWTTATSTSCRRDRSEYIHVYAFPSRRLSSIHNSCRTERTWQHPLMKEQWEESRVAVSVKERVIEGQLKEERWSENKVTLSLDSIMKRERDGERPCSYNINTHNTSHGMHCRLEVGGMSHFISQ